MPLSGCGKKKLNIISTKEKETSTSAMIARGRFTPGGSVSLFMINTSAKEKDKIINVTTDAALLNRITSC